MNWTLTIDPGLRDLGVALWSGEGPKATLYRAALIRNDVQKERGPKAWVRIAKLTAEWVNYTTNGALANTLVLEHMVIREKRQQKGDQDDVLQLVGVEGALSAFLGSEHTAYKTYIPEDWKRQVPQDVLSRRAISKLTDVERSAIEPCPAHLLHNVGHSIGLGLVHLKRTGLGCVDW